MMRCGDDVTMCWPDNGMRCSGLVSVRMRFLLLLLQPGRSDCHADNAVHRRRCGLKSGGCNLWSPIRRCCCWCWRCCPCWWWYATGWWLLLLLGKGIFVVEADDGTIAASSAARLAKLLLLPLLPQPRLHFCCRIRWNCDCPLMSTEHQSMHVLLSWPRDNNRCVMKRCLNSWSSLTVQLSGAETTSLFISKCDPVFNNTNNNGTCGSTKV